MPDSLASIVDDGASITVEKDNKVAAAIQPYVVATMDMKTAQEDPGVPKEGDTHPVYSHLTCDDVGFAWNSANIDATARYSFDGRFKLSASTLSRPIGWFEWTSDYREFPVSLAYGAMIQDRVPSTGRLVNTWHLKEFEFTERRPVRILTVVVRRTNAMQFDIADAEVGNLHHIDGQQVKFIGFGTTVIDDKTTQAQYEWMVDYGTPLYTSVYDGDSELIRYAAATNPIDLERFPGLIRSPYEKIKGVSRGGDVPPYIYGEVDAKGFHDDGHLALPGGRGRG